jgi:hypothetical protein
MDWENEEWVKLYRRETPEWLSLSWKARGLFRLLMTRVDPSGVLEVGRRGREAVLAALVIPRSEWPEALAALDELIDDGCLIMGERAIVMPGFLDAQTARTSDRERARRSREQARKRALDEAAARPAPVTARHEGVTPRHDSVTACHDKRDEREERDESVRSAEPPTASAPLLLDVEPAPKPSGVKPTAARVLARLNELGHKRFESSPHLETLIRKGVPEADLLAVVEHKAGPGGLLEYEGGKFYRPKTLFGRDNFEGYLAEARSAADSPPATPGLPLLDPDEYLPINLRSAAEDARRRAEFEARLGGAA